MPVFQNSLHGMAYIDGERRLRDVNHAACVMVQRPLEMLLRARIDDLTAPIALHEIEKTWRDMIEQGSQTGRWPLVTGDQRLIEVEYSAVANARGPLHLVVFVTRRVAPLDPAEGVAASTPLTERESEVLSLLALGYTGPEIAERLVIGVDTVRTHIRRLKAKLGARTLPHLVALAMSHQK